MVAAIFSMFVFRVGFSYLLGENMGLGAIGVWIAMILDWVFRVICFVARYFQGKWQRSCTWMIDPIQIWIMEKAAAVPLRWRYTLFMYAKM